MLLVPNGVSAKMRMPDGSKPALPGPWTFRITEYTAGPGGKAAMPGELPPATQYTYAVEFSVDQADAAGATGVEFSTPLINYVENFADVPVGNGMPSGAYDRATGRWIAAPDGRVIAITAETGGLAEIDLDGKSGADTAQALHAFGISDDERRVLADLYAPGAQLMRMLVPHFSPWDHNSGMGIPPGARVPRLQDFIWKDPNDPCKNSLFSEIACERQTVIERIPIAGTPYELAYTNDRQPGWKADSKLTLPITGVQVPALVGQIEATVDVAGRRVASGIWCDPTRVGITFQTDCQARPDLVPNLELPIEWDGLDAYGRRVQGRPYATVRLTYYYKGFSYGSPYEAEASFGRAAEGQSFEMRGECRQLPGSNDVILGGNGADRRPPQPPPPDCLLGMEVSARRTLGTLDAQSWLGLGGWTVSPVHALDTVDSTVFRGDGATSRGEVLGPRVTRVGGLAFSNGGAGNFPEAEGRPGNEVSFDYLSDIAVSADGSIFVLHSPCFFGNDGGLRRISPDGTKTTTMAPRSRCYGPPPGDDEEFQADSDDPNRPNFLDGNTYHVAAGPNGEAYVTVVDSNSTGQATSALIVRRVDRDGTVRTVAGVPWSGAFNFNEDGDGGPARNAKLRISNDAPLAVAPDGTIYVVDSQDRIRRIGTDGVIDTYAGGGLDATQDQDLGDGERALNHDFGAITGMTVGFDGSLYVADRDEFRILRIRPDGQLQRVAGIGTNTIGLGGPALQQGIGRPLDVAQNREGELIVRTIVPATANGSPVRLLTINTEGGMTPLAGKIDGEECDESAEFRIPDGRPARDACFFSYAAGGGLALTGDGDPVIMQSRYWIYRASGPYKDSPGSALVASPDGRDVYAFDGAGRHTRTLDALTGAVEEQFSYAGGALAAIKDADNRETTIRRAAGGLPTGIRAPEGLETTFETFADGRLKAVINPAGERYEMTYAEGGLLTSFKRDGGATSSFTYDGLGRLKTAQSPGGRALTLTRAETSTSSAVTVASSTGREVVYSSDVNDQGERRRTITYPGGAQETVTVGADGVSVATAIDGTKTATATTGDPRFGGGAQLLAERTTTTPAGKSRTTTITRSVTLRDQQDPFSLEEMTVATKTGDGFDDPQFVDHFRAESDDDNGPITSRTIERSTGVFGEDTEVKTLDTRGRVTAVDSDGESGPLDPITYTWGANGRVQKVQQGTESLTFGFDPRGRPNSITDAAGKVETLEWDLADRLITRTLPGGGVYRYEYDGNGEPTAVKTPNTGAGQPLHDLAVTPDGLLSGHTAPGAPAAETWTFDTDRRLTAHGVPGGQEETLAFTPEGRTARIGDTHFSYAGPAGRATEMKRDVDGDSGDASVHHTYDGGLITSIATTGASPSSLGLGFDALMRVNRLTLTIDGVTADTQNLVRDEADRVTSAGPLTFRRDDSGLVDLISDLSGFGRSRSYDGAGRERLRVDSTQSADLYREAVTRDNRGLVTRRVETVAGQPVRTLDYTYDDAGRLQDVKDGGTVVERHRYDLRGNRISVQRGADPVTSASFDAADRVLTLGALAYDHDDAGRMTGRGTDAFSYNARGDLVRAVVGGTTVVYRYDGFGRLVAREQGADKTRYVYGDPGDPTRVSAVVDPAGAVTLLRYDEQGRVVALERGGERFLVATDVVGTPKVVAKADGTVVKTLRHDAYGKVMADSAPSFDLPVGFAGGIVDAVTGFVRYGLRTYDPESAQFLTSDPSRWVGSPRNLYAYVDGDPVAQRDPTGLGAMCGGGSIYTGVGLGLSGCVGEDETAPGKTAVSLCLEAGVGVQGGVEGGVQKNVDSSGSKLFAEGGVELGMGFGLGGELSLDCFEAQGKASVTAAGITGEINSAGEVAVKTGFGGGAKGGIKACARW